MAEVKNLVVVRAGDFSLHPSWLAVEARARNWHLHISYFGKRPSPYGDLPEGVSLSREEGTKYQGLATCLAKFPGWLDQYERIAFPDDDLQASRGGWSEVFDILAEAGAPLGQPSLDQLSFFSHPVTLCRPRYRYRETNFIEVMAPVFCADLLKQCLPLFTENVTSWGLDYLFARQARENDGKMVIVDAVNFLHTRRVGKGGQYKPGEISPREDRKQTLARHGIRIYEGKAIRGARVDGGVDGPFRVGFGVSRAFLNKWLVDFLGVNTVMR